MALSQDGDKKINLYDFKMQYMDEDAIIISNKKGIWIVDRQEFDEIAYYQVK